MSFGRRPIAQVLTFAFVVGIIVVAYVTLFSKQASYASCSETRRNDSVEALNAWVHGLGDAEFARNLPITNPHHINDVQWHQKRDKAYRDYFRKLADLKKRKC